MQTLRCAANIAGVRHVRPRPSSLATGGGTMIAHRSYFAATVGIETHAKRGDVLAPRYVVDHQGHRISPWHDIPMSLQRDSRTELHNFVCEVPRGTKEKYEISVTLPYNPIVVDRVPTRRRLAEVFTRGEPRHYSFPVLVNHGAMPQTYSDPSVVDAVMGLPGDGEPLDVCEIGSRVVETGAVYAVRILGALAMVDGGKADWKLLAIRPDDPLAASLRDMSDFRGESLRRLLEDIQTWFRTTKVAEGKPENAALLDARWLTRDEALQVVASAHEQWQNLCARRLKLANSQLYNEEPLAEAMSPAPWTVDEEFSSQVTRASRRKYFA